MEGRCLNNAGWGKCKDKGMQSSVNMRRQDDTVRKRTEEKRTEATERERERESYVSRLRCAQLFASCMTLTLFRYAGWCFLVLGPTTVAFLGGYI